LAVRKNFAQKYPTTVSTIARLFEISKNNGLKNLKTIIQYSASALNLSPEFCESYYHRLNYDFSINHMMGLKTFFRYLHQYNLVDEKPGISFFQS
jgi:predicted solute-binding protein